MRYSWLMRLLQIPFGLIAPLGLAATPFLLRRRTFLLLAFLYSYAASIVLFFVLTRYRIPVVPVLLLLAAFTTVHLVEEVRRRDWRRLLQRAALIVPLFIICNTNFYGISPATGEAQGHFRLGIIYQGEGRLEDAEQEYRASIRLDPDYARSRLNLGELLAVTGRGEEAEEQFREALAIDPSYTKAHLNLGTVLYRSGRLAEGEVEIRRALELDGGYGRAWLHMAALSLLEGERAAGEEARKAAATLDATDPIRPLAAELLGRIEEVEEMGRWREASGLPWELPLPTREAMVAELFRDRVDVEALYREGADGGDPSALYALGAYHYREGRVDDAAPLFDAARERGRGMPFLSFALGVLRARQGEEEEALRFFVRETEVHPSFAPAWKNAALLSARAGSSAEARRFAAEYVRLGGERDEGIASILE